MSGIVGQNAGRDSGVVGAVDFTVSDNAIDETKLKDALVADFTQVVVAAGDSFLLGDSSDSGNTKRDTIQGILDLASHTGNVAFPATQSASGDANTLDDYEEGTWTPVIGGSGGQSGQAYTTQSGTYTKIGRAVTLYFYVLLSTKGTISGSYVYISGAPFSTGFNEGSSMQITSFSSLTNGWTTIPGGYGGGAFWYVVGRKGAAIGTGSVNMAPADISATTMFRGTMTYRV